MGVKSSFYNEYDIKNNEKPVFWAQRSFQNHHQTFHDRCPEKIGPLPKKSDHWSTRSDLDVENLVSRYHMVKGTRLSQTSPHNTSGCAIISTWTICSPLSILPTLYFSGTHICVAQFVLTASVCQMQLKIQREEWPLAPA